VSQWSGFDALDGKLGCYVEIFVRIEQNALEQRLPFACTY